MTWEAFFLENYTQDLVENLVPDPFIKNQNWTYTGPTVWNARLPLFLIILGNIRIVIIWCPVCDLINVEINHNFLIKPFSCITKGQDKYVSISRMKRTFNMI